CRNERADFFDARNRAGANFGAEALVEALEIDLQRLVGPRATVAHVDQARIRLEIAGAIEVVNELVEFFVQRFGTNTFVAGTPQGDAGMIAETLDAILRVPGEQIKIHRRVIEAFR